MSEHNVEHNQVEATQSGATQSGGVAAAISRSDDLEFRESPVAVNSS